MSGTIRPTMFRVIHTLWRRSLARNWLAGLRAGSTSATTATMASTTTTAPRSLQRVSSHLLVGLVGPNFRPSVGPVAAPRKPAGRPERAGATIGFDEAYRSVRDLAPVEPGAGVVDVQGPRPRMRISVRPIRPSTRAVGIRAATGPIGEVDAGTRGGVNARHRGAVRGSCLAGRGSPHSWPTVRR